ncbi:MAG: metallopeptidase family protein [Syntrophales bacterium]|nr:metallopeptidase family protein [Syntrophales bacterium]
MKLSRREFERAVEKAISRIPDEIRQALDNVAIMVEKRPSPELLESVGIAPDEPPPLGLYVGSSLRERSFFTPTTGPDTIFIFQEPLESLCRSLEELEEEIEITVVHEIAHFLGLSDERLEELGYG